MASRSAVSIGLGECLHTVVGGRQVDQHALAPEVVPCALRHFRTFANGTEERPGQVLPELGLVLQHILADPVEGFDRRALGVAVGLQHDRRHGAGRDDLRHTPLTVGCGVFDDLASSG